MPRSAECWATRGCAWRKICRRWSAQGGLAIAAGTLLIVVGLSAAGVVPRRVRAAVRAVLPFSMQSHVGTAAAPGPACLASGLLGTFLRAPGWGNVFLAGVMTGLLPCGLVYGFLALACSTANLWVGAATMAAFGLGTVPLMVLTGTGASLVSIVTRQRLLRFAAWCVVLTGIVSLARGTYALTADGSSPTPACPACEVGL